MRSTTATTPSYEWWSPMSEERTRKRLSMLEQRIAAGADDPFIFYARAMELRSLGELERSLGALDEVEAKFPDYVPTFLMAAQIASELDRPDAARGYLTRGLSLATRVGDEHARSELQQALDAL